MVKGNIRNFLQYKFFLLLTKESIGSVLLIETNNIYTVYVHMDTYTTNAHVSTYTKLH